MEQAAMAYSGAMILDFSIPYAEEDEVFADTLLKKGRLSVEQGQRVDVVTRRLIGAIRAKGGRLGGVEDMLHEFALSSREGVAIMVLAEALLRIPDPATVDRLIEDKLGQGDFANREARSDTLLVNASAWALGITARIIRPGETPDSVLGHLIKRLGLPAVRGAMRRAMRLLGSYFVLGQTIEEALERARSGAAQRYRYSFDMLGEGARTAADARGYFESYEAAIEAIGRTAGSAGLPQRPGISVKLSALHPRYESLSRARVLVELVPLVVALASKAKAHDLNFTIDAEEADRLELSIDVIGAAFVHPALADWDGFGLAIQAYQKRAGAVIDWVANLTERSSRRMMVRYRDLLAYLVRRLLENGANSSFVSAVADPNTPIEMLLAHPADQIGTPSRARHPSVPLPAALFGHHRVNSRGVEFGHHASLTELVAEIRMAGQHRWTTAPVIDGATIAGPKRKLVSPIDGRTETGCVFEANQATVERAIDAARHGFRTWSCTPAEVRARALERAADALEASRGQMVHLLQVEAGKTIEDAVAELREAVDFCRFYAAEARRLFNDGLIMPGPTGESNRLRLRGRGVFAAISPWNFPLAIFVGQVAAALAAGNAVVAKPAEQTPLVAAAAVRLLHAAGIPGSALQFVPGDGAIGACLVADPRIDGVAFTGSCDVARRINQILAARHGPIVPLIAETGGINAMIVDATALPEQVTDDVIISAFRSSGQRCSALRLLCVQDDIADRLIEMIAGAARELRVRRSARC
jgi:delta-1-pyrroline-5-carboxylate dehydrogenase PutA-like protein